MCAIPAIAKLAGGSPLGAVGGSLFGIPGAVIGARLLAKKKQSPMAGDPSYQSALAQGVGPKKAMQTAILVNQRNAASASGQGY
jgi:hypothetical protein